MWEIKPILIILWRNRLGAVLVTVQIALTIGITCNAISIISDKLHYINRDSGMAENDIFSIFIKASKTQAETKDMIVNDINTLRNIHGVVAVTTSNAVPLSRSGGTMGITSKPNDPVDRHSCEFFDINEEGLDAMGVKLIAGRNFRADEFSESFKNLNTTILTQKLANRLFPDGNALNNTIYLGGNPFRIIGIVERCLGRLMPRGEQGMVAFLPRLLFDKNTHYIVRANAGSRDQVMRKAEKELNNLNRQRVINPAVGLDKTKDKTYVKDRVMVNILSITSLLLTLITLMGIVGLTVFWINQRRKQIGTRRALGASKLAITRYFLIENLILSGTGILLGSFLALGFNSLLVQHYNQQALDIRYLLISSITIILLGLFAALWPALRAADIPPALATRSV